MARSVKYRENTLAFVYGIFAALSIGAAGGIFYSREFDFSALSILHMIGMGACVLLMGFFMFRAFQQAFWSGLGGFMMILVGVLVVAGVLFLPDMLVGARGGTDIVVDAEAARTPTVEMVESGDVLAEVTEEAGPTGCMLWSDVDNSYVDQEICVYGELALAYSSEGAFFMLFSDEPGEIFFLAYNWGDASLKGRCVQTTGVVKRLGASPVIVVTKQEDLQFCD
ncbi:MAG: hypothetical protein K8R77_16275 [Anaerolineaceae bacterium]|nr:hypothetical protein [Anaerolineaceae bacterium]